jgi:hypothetical protein
MRGLASSTAAHVHQLPLAGMGVGAYQRERHSLLLDNGVSGPRPAFADASVCGRRGRIEEGPRLTTWVTGISPDELRIGMLNFGSMTSATK